MLQYNKMIQKMISFDDVIKEETKGHNPHWPKIRNNNNWRLWIRKNKFTIESNKLAIRY